MTKNGSGLFAQHRQVLEDRAVVAEVIEDRGYVSADTQAGLRRWGFGASQAEVARDGGALVIPIYDVLGERATVQMRPDQPRALKGKVLKYETATGSNMVLDVPRRVRPHIGDPGRPLVITEGPIKADALVSAGLDAMALLGVWCFKGTNGAGGKVVLAAFDHIAFNGRQVYVCFDSDAMLKVEVHEAMARFAAVLELRGANVAYIYLPHGEAGAKVGVDDFLATGHSTEELLALASPELRGTTAGTGTAARDTFDDVAHEPGWQVLDDVETLLRRFVVFANDQQPVAVALWVVHTHALDAADTTPRLAITSPEKRSGKSRLLEVLELVCRNAERSVNVSIPYLFRSIERERPTVLFDEIDTVFGSKVNAAHEELRGIVNAGHRRGATVGRMVGEGAAMLPKRYDVFCPVALAGIGQPPETIVDRSINIELRRRSPDQSVDPFRLAWFAWRFPPRLRRCRWVTLPEVAGNGATPHRCAQAASDLTRSALSPAATNKMAAVSMPTP